MNEVNHPGPAETRPRAGYELSDLKPRSIGLFIAALAVTISIVLILAYWIFAFYAGREATENVPPSPLASTRKPPPPPRLQVMPARDLEEIRATEEAVLNSYGWVDKEAGIVRLPIDRAIDVLAKRGLPVRNKTKAARGDNAGQSR